MDMNEQFGTLEWYTKEQKAHRKGGHLLLGGRLDDGMNKLEQNLVNRRLGVEQDSRMEIPYRMNIGQCRQKKKKKTFVLCDHDVLSMSITRGRSYDWKHPATVRVCVAKSMSYCVENIFAFICSFQTSFSFRSTHPA